MKNKGPYEVLFQQPPSCDHLKNFGCLCFISTLSHNRNKFAARAKRCVFLGYPSGIKGYKILSLDSNCISVSRDIVFYVTIFPFAVVPESSISDSDSLGSDSFVFLHCVSGSSYHFPPHLVQPSFTNSAVPNTADTSNAGPAPISSTDIPALTPISGCNSETGLVPSPVTRVLAVLQPRKSSKAHNLPSYFRDYSCNAVFSTPASGSPYDISNFLTFTHLNKAYKHIVFALQGTPTEPTSFHQAVQSPEWRTAMDKEIQAL